MAIKLN